MAQQPRFFRKNLIDLDYDCEITVTDAIATNNGQSYVDQMRNRSNDSGWMTTNSTDAANTTLEVDMVDSVTIDSILLIGHNLKAYTIKYWTGAIWADFPTPIAETTNTLDGILHQFSSTITTKIQIIITGTMVADADKVIRQLIITRKIGAGQFEGWPIFRKATIDLSKKALDTLSGKSKIIERVGAYGVELDFKTWPVDADLSILEQIHFYQPRGFLFWPSGGDETQFKYKRFGFRNIDIFLCGVLSEWNPDWDNGMYGCGMNIKVKLTEVI